MTYDPVKFKPCDDKYQELMTLISLLKEPYRSDVLKITQGRLALWFDTLREIMIREGKHINCSTEDLR